MRILRMLVYLSTSVLSVEMTPAASLLTPADVLIIRFNTLPPFSRPSVSLAALGPENSPTYLDVQLGVPNGVPLSISGRTLITVRLYDGSTLLGSYSADYAPPQLDDPPTSVAKWYSPADP